MQCNGVSVSCSLTKTPQFGQCSVAWVRRDTSAQRFEALALLGVLRSGVGLRFRAHTAKSVRWGGEKHQPEDEDDPTRMHPRTSFKAFLEIVYMRSQPWEDVEMDAVHSLQLILRSAQQVGT